jgi:TetR/AcrR family transcriptional regulator, regulator of mycofactocin system
VALELFAKRGYERTTVDDVAGAAGVSARTVFRYFPVKADLLFGDADADLEELRRLLSRQDGSLPPFEAARRALNDFSARIGAPAYADRARVITESPSLGARALEVREQWAEAVAAELAKRRGLAAPEETDRLAGLLVVAVLVTALREWSHDGDGPGALRETIERFAARATEILQP